jgi:hypothetical protein
MERFIELMRDKYLGLLFEKLHQVPLQLKDKCNHTSSQAVILQKASRHLGFLGV